MDIDNSVVIAGGGCGVRWKKLWGINGDRKSKLKYIFKFFKRNVYK